MTIVSHRAEDASTGAFHQRKGKKPRPPTISPDSRSSPLLYTIDGRTRHPGRIPTVKHRFVGADFVFREDGRERSNVQSRQSERDRYHQQGTYIDEEAKDTAYGFGREWDIVRRLGNMSADLRLIAISSRPVASHLFQDGVSDH